MSRRGWEGLLRGFQGERQKGREQQQEQKRGGGDEEGTRRKEEGRSRVSDGREERPHKREAEEGRRGS